MKRALLPPLPLLAKGRRGACPPAPPLSGVPGYVGSGNPFCGPIFMLENMFWVDAWYLQPDHPYPEYTWAHPGLKLCNNCLDTPATDIYFSLLTINFLSITWDFWWFPFSNVSKRIRLSVWCFSAFSYNWLSFSRWNLDLPCSGSKALEKYQEEQD